MCAPIPFGAHLRHPHSRVFSVHRALARQTTISSPVLQGISQVTAPQPLTLTIIPVTIPPAASSPSASISISGLSSQVTQTLAPSMSTIRVTSSTYVPNWQPSSVPTLPGSFTPNMASSKPIVSTVFSSSESAAVSSMSVPISTWAMSPTDETTILVSTMTIMPVTSQPSDTTTSSILSTETDNSLSETFTLAPSSTLSIIIDPSSSVTAASTTNGTALAIGTVISSPISARPASLSAHNPPFYIGIILGTVAAIACLCALVAWFIRLRNHTRRRREARSLKLPWDKSGNGDTWGLESGRGVGSNADLAISAMNLGSREDLADIQAWSPRGDRDVGEPRRTESYMHGSTYSLQNHPIPEYWLFSDDSVRAFASSEGYSTASLLPHHNLRQLPSHLIDHELAARVNRERASLRSNGNIDQMDFASRTNGDCGTPRETINKPRFLSLRGQGLNVPWNVNSERSPRSMVERLRSRKPLPAEPSWEQISPLQSSGEINTKTNIEAEPWSTSFKSNLVSAFNAVAANLSSAAGAPQMGSDRFTPALPKARVRKSVRDTFWDDNLIKAKELSRETSISTVTSTEWTLEETREGAGIVHLFIPGLQETDIERPRLSGPTLSFGDGDGVVSDGDSNRRPMVEHPQVPLIASEKPPPAVMRPDSCHMRRNTRNAVNSSLSHARSMASMHIGAQTRKLTFQPNLKASNTGSGSIDLSDNPYFDDRSDPIVVESSRISRLSSSDSSATSTILYGTDDVIEEDLNAASLALKDRRNRMLEV